MSQQNLTENLGPAETLLNMILSYTDHIYHGRPGIVKKDNASNIGVTWYQASYKEENGIKVVYQHEENKKPFRIGTLSSDNKTVVNGNSIIGEYRKSGIFAEAASWMYDQIGKIYQMNNEIVARWASYVFNDNKDYKDLKVVLAAFLLCQARKGDPVIENDKIVFYDDDFRDVGEAMCLLSGKKVNEMKAKYLMRIYDVLSLPKVAEINRKLGFGNSARKPFLGRWPKTMIKWLSFRDLNPKVLEKDIKDKWKSDIKRIARTVGFKPSSEAFFQALRWKQVQAKDGRRSLAIGKGVSQAETWKDLSEEEICQKIEKTKPNYKHLVSMLPNGFTKAILAVAMEKRCFSNKELMLLSSTLESHGILDIPELKKIWEDALKSDQATKDARAANVLKNVKSSETKAALQESADLAAKKSVEDKIKNLMVCVITDKSGSMDGAINKSVEYASQLVQAFPLDKIHAVAFDAVAYPVDIKHASSAGVKKAYSNFSAGGGTNHSAAINYLARFKPKADEQVIFIFFGDEEDTHTNFVNAVKQSGLNPVAFGLVRVLGSISNGRGAAVRTTAQLLGIPCFQIDQKAFSDPYAIPRVLSNLIDSTPVGFTENNKVKKESLIEKIVSYPMLKKPTWA